MYGNVIYEAKQFLFRRQKVCVVKKQKRNNEARFLGLRDEDSQKMLFNLSGYLNPSNPIGQKPVGGHHAFGNRDEKGVSATSVAGKGVRRNFLRKWGRSVNVLCDFSVKCNGGIAQW